jgi:hypothetical protein
MANQEDRNINITLGKYYASLIEVDKCYKELENSHRVSHRCKEVLDDAEKLSTKNDLSKSSNVTQFVINQLNPEYLEHYLRNQFKEFQEAVRRIEDFRKNYQYHLNTIQNSYADEIRLLQKREEEIEQKRGDAIESIASTKISAFACGFAIAGITLLAAFFSKDIGFVIITAIVGLVGSEFLPDHYLRRGLVRMLFYITSKSEEYRNLVSQWEDFNRYTQVEKERLLQEKSSEEAKLRSELEDLRQEANVCLEQMRAYVAHSQDEIEVKRSLLRNEWQKQKEKISTITKQLKRSVSKWEDTRWNEKQEGNESETEGYSVHKNDDQYSLFRFGDLYIDRELGSNQSVPAILTLRSHGRNAKGHWSGHVAMFSNNGDSRQAVLGAIEALAIRTIASFPPLLCKSTFIDPVNAGNTFPFRNFPPSIVGKQTFTRSEDIREQLRALTQHIEHVIQNNLNRQYNTIEDYNDEAKIREAYRFIFIADFPSGFDRPAIEDLKSILLNGPRAGVYAILHIDGTLEKPRDFRYELFEELCTVLRPADGLTPHFIIRLLDGEAFRTHLDIPPDSEQFKKLAKKLKKAVEDVSQDAIQFTHFCPEQLWSQRSDRNLCVPIGVEGAKGNLEFLLGSKKSEDGGSYETPHALLAGGTGSGKSTTLHAIICNLALRYSPEELELYLLDYKEGVEFQVYVAPNCPEGSNAFDDPDPARILPHAQVISIESDAEFGLSVLDRALGEIKARSDRFKSEGAKDLKEYREKTEKKLPRLLIVIDEYQQMYLQADSRLCERLNDALEAIAKQGRSFGVHLLLSSQSPRVRDFRERIYEQMAVRMAMKMSRSSASLLMAEGNVDVVEHLDRAGKIAYNDHFGEKGYNKIGQVAYIDEKAHPKVIEKVLRKSQEQNYQRPTATVVFNGNQAAQLKHNSEFKGG